MIGTGDLAQLVALRALREEWAQTAVSVASVGLEKTIRMAIEAEAALDAHNFEAAERERQFFAAMQIRPAPENELGRARDLMRIADHHRDTLIVQRNQHLEAVSECRRQLALLRGEWCTRLAERDKLIEAYRRLSVVEQARKEAATEQEAGDMGIGGTGKDRARAAC